MKIRYLSYFLSIAASPLLDSLLRAIHRYFMLQAYIQYPNAAS